MFLTNLFKRASRQETERMSLPPNGDWRVVVRSYNGVRMALNITEIGMDTIAFRADRRRGELANTERVAVELFLGEESGPTVTGLVIDVRRHPARMSYSGEIQLDRQSHQERRKYESFLRRLRMHAQSGAGPTHYIG